MSCEALEEVVDGRSNFLWVRRCCRHACLGILKFWLHDYISLPCWLPIWLSFLDWTFVHVPDALFCWIYFWLAFFTFLMKFWYFLYDQNMQRWWVHAGKHDGDVNFEIWSILTKHVCLVQTGMSRHFLCKLTCNHIFLWETSWGSWIYAWIWIWMRNLEHFGYFHAYLICKPLRFWGAKHAWHVGDMSYASSYAKKC